MGDVPLRQINLITGKPALNSALNRRSDDIDVMKRFSLLRKPEEIEELDEDLDIEHAKA